MTYKLICLDMDGTLLNNNKKISDRTKKSIKEAHKKGVKIAISTGRIFTSAKYYAHILGISAPIIASNGAYIREKDKNEIIYKSILSKDQCIDIINITKKYDFNFYLNTCDTIISSKPYPKGYTYLEMSSELPEDMKIKLEVNTNLEEEVFKKNGEIIKAICISNDSEILEKARQEILNLKSLEVVSSLGDNFEIMNKGVSKGKGVQKLAEFYGLTSDEVICMGDGENDLSMIEYAGLGIAMGNAPDFIKEKANYITDTNDNDGVAKAIEKFVLLD
ncbi:Cof-type HAD-IIB family hydrolase [Clostridium botulinum]|uniref:HAD hydrolase, IIB family n=1 Tax=Clostridium botulinum D str. 1873 TaxID=592027 RepID=A0A9P2LLI2_CLOBO|nr:MULTISPECIES: Cof-type HAD-IIB family hydrolase [Clostridium]AYF53528.1 Cof-type HAD-IIB family hydrolase [Clostridium novyi]EES91598.1 HAD hydrolase, IIB family [Clostridium botulinum D str. 1873]MBO3440881.1 Cof-type HAD-IIB family hydrolase [Clostridium haemolyticum]NFV48033.1 Cof-type HAD-IIB family hydrolase [Clostridium botulinum]QPW55792.1 Cof-type HAD-IIB family hydrolase [Clostridium botulinum]